MNCPHCKNDREDLIEWLPAWQVYVCTVCSKLFKTEEVTDDPKRKSQADSKDTKKEIPESHD